MKNARKVNKELVKIRKIDRNVSYGSLTLVYILVHTIKLNKKAKKINLMYFLKKDKM